MADEIGLEQRIHQLMGGLCSAGFAEKRMFGGVGFLVGGNMACGVNKGRLIVRVGPGAYARALARPHAGAFDMTGRPMAGWVMVAAEGCQSEADLERWVREGVEFALSLPAE